jgi:putative AlgH/UPF0301 family transcriptional regulator
MSESNSESQNKIFNIQNKRSPYQGLVLAANPLNPKNRMEKSVILVMNQIGSAIIGLQLNNQIADLQFNDVIRNLGFWSATNPSVYFGGNLGPNRLHLVHSLDWSSLTTVVVNNQIGVTSDISILAAISEHQGPEYFRACAGYWSWGDELLSQQIDSVNNPDQEYKWECTEADIENVFEYNEEDQWNHIIMKSTELQIKKWLN